MTSEPRLTDDAMRAMLREKLLAKRVVRGDGCTLLYASDGEVRPWRQIVLEGRARSLGFGAFVWEYSHGTHRLWGRDEEGE